ncbi:uncharacterized protein LOC128553230 [Mercenaria mercenaria]|uniref:uncharacterized protein LOC128553230 n=1 Tax=Mercenaria mercenaria TaxID=6596 RepID=UPI00234F7EBA|nr:uncharacterized protein LOC128553230 [Mercenaria mercenaria]
MTKRYVSAIGKHGKMSVSQLDEAYRSAIDEIEKQRKKVVKEVQAEGEKQKKIIEAKGRAISKKIIIAVQTKADIVKRKMRKQFNQEVKRLKTEANANVIMIPSEAGKAVKEIKEAIDTGVKEIGANPVIMLSSAVTRMEQLNDCAEALKHTEKSKTESEKDTYNKLKKELKDDLATFYKTRYSTIPLSPLVEGHDTPLANFYILPEMNFLEKQDKKPAGEETKTPVKSLSDVFQSENSCEIYLTADAGFGKTAFSKYLAVTWCQAHCPERKYKTYFSVDAINAMRDFEFLFLVLLRDSSDDCSIDDLIMNQIIQNLSLLSSEMTMHSLQRILHREKSLIILDGLDEWTHPKKKCTKVPKTIPHRNAREKCVILTTTRPWKLGVLNLKTSEIDKKVELVKLTSESAQTLEERAISKIKNLDVAEAKILAKQLNENIKKNKLEDLESVPLLSMYLICLWCEDIPLGQSKCGLYASIIELLLSRTKSKHPAMEPTCEPSQSDIPQCFSEHEHCNQYCTYLKALGKLAFETLFSETKESTLVFTKSIVDKYLSPNDFKLSLDLGILTQSTERTLIKQISKVSFSHSTMHTFYCALYASFQNENDIKDIVLKTCKSLQSILDMSTLFVFISGMNTDIMSSISHEFLSVINVDKRTSEYRSHLEYEQYAKHPLKDIQDMYISCMKENTSDKELKLFCQDFFFSGDCKEEKYFSQLTRLMVHNKNNLESININTWLDGISLCTIIDSCALRELFQMNKIFYVGQGEEEQLPVLLNRSPKCVTVRSPRLSGSCSREMWETLQNNSLLQAICISGFAMSHDILNDFLNYIINRKTMTEIRLCYLSCIEHKRSCAFSLDFSQHSDLRKLELAEIPEVSQLKINSQVKHLELEEIKLGEKSLPPEMKNIESVDLQSVIMSASTLYDLVEVLKKLLHKVTVKIVGGKIKPTPEFKALKQYIHSSQNFRVMKDEGWGKFVFETKVES